MKLNKASKLDMTARNAVRMSGRDDIKAAKQWDGHNPICPYGCGEEGVLKEVVMKPDGTAIGLFHDSEGLVFQADIKLNDDDSRKVKLKRGIGGELRLG